jgi:hypothetical protein
VNLPNLYLVQDADRPLYVVAADFGDALRQWQAQMLFESNLDSSTEEQDLDPQPQGVQLIAKGHEVLQAKPVDDQSLREQLVQLVRRMVDSGKERHPTRFLDQTNAELVNLAIDAVGPLLALEKRAGRLEDWIEAVRTRGDVARAMGDEATAKRCALYVLESLQPTGWKASTEGAKPDIATEQRQAQGGAS